MSKAKGAKKQWFSHRFQVPAFAGMTILTQIKDYLYFAWVLFKHFSGWNIKLTFEEKLLSHLNIPSWSLTALGERLDIRFKSC